MANKGQNLQSSGRPWDCLCCFTVTERVQQKHDSFPHDQNATPKIKWVYKILRKTNNHYGTNVQIEKCQQMEHQNLVKFKASLTWKPYTSESRSKVNCYCRWLFGKVLFYSAFASHHLTRKVRFHISPKLNICLLWFEPRTPCCSLFQPVSTMRKPFKTNQIVTTFHFPILSTNNANPKKIGWIWLI